MNSTGLAIFSLVFFVAVVAFGLKKKVHLGALGMGASLVLGLLIVQENGLLLAANQSKAITSLPDYNLWITLIGCSVLGALALEDGTMEVLVKKMLHLSGGRKWLLPIFMLLFFFLQNSLGLGGVNLLPVVLPLVAVMSLKEGIPFILLTACSHCMFGSTFSNLNSTGIMLNNMMDELGIVHRTSFFTNAYTAATAAGLLIYAVTFVVFGGLKMGRANIQEMGPAPKLEKGQWVTILGLLGYVALIIAFNASPGLAGMLMASVLAVYRKIDVTNLYKRIPMPTILLIGGMSMFVKVVKAAGGIDLIVSLFTSIMTKSTAMPMLVLAGGCLSIVSSALGVVIPTFVPMVPEIAAATGVNATALVTCVAVGGHSTGITPFSVTGGLNLGIYSSAGASKEQVDTLFKQLFIFGGMTLAINAVLAFLGWFNFLA